GLLRRFPTRHFKSRTGHRGMLALRVRLQELLEGRDGIRRFRPSPTSLLQLHAGLRYIAAVGVLQQKAFVSRRIVLEASHLPIVQFRRCASWHKKQTKDQAAAGQRPTPTGAAYL